MSNTDSIETLYKEIDVEASEAQHHGGSISWRKAREWAYRLCRIDLESVVVAFGEYAYQADCQRIIGSNIGLLKLALLRGDSALALQKLQAMTVEIHASMKKNLPEQFAAMTQSEAKEEHGTERAVPQHA